MKSFDNFDEYVDFLRFMGSYDIKIKAYWKRSGIYRLSIAGDGITPLFIRNLFHKRCNIISIVCNKVEVKCFPYTSTFTSLFSSAISSFPDLPIPQNRLYNWSINTVFYKQLGRYVFDCYHRKCFLQGWGSNLELSCHQEIHESAFDGVVADMLGSLMSYVSFSDLRPLGKVISYNRHKRPSGFLLVPIKKRNVSLAGLAFD